MDFELAMLIKQIKYINYAYLISYVILHLEKSNQCLVLAEIICGGSKALVSAGQRSLRARSLWRGRSKMEERT